MFDFFVSLFTILIYLAAAYGWGRLAADRLYAHNRLGWVMTVVVGLGVWIFIGGLLNAARLAFPMALDTMLGVGVGLAIAFACRFVNKLHIGTCFRDGHACFRDHLFSHWLPLAMIGLILSFLVLTLMPASAFNFHDDFHIYMPRLIRMLETGSLGGNPFDMLGVDSLGAQAFMQSFFVNRLSLNYVNAFDAILCFVLGVLLLWEMGRRFRIHWAFLLASLLTFVGVDPEYVNISSLYSASLMVLATVFASILFAEDMVGTGNKRAFAGALAVALFLTSLVSLKLTYGVFAATYFVVYFGCAMHLSENRARMVRSMFFTIVAAMILITPWILLSLPNYVAALRIASEGKAWTVTGGNDGGMDFISRIAVVFSVTKSRWGGNFLTYSLLASLLAAAGATSLLLLMKSHDILYRQRLVVISAVCIAAAISFVTTMQILDPWNGIRYSIPILLAAASVTVLLFVPNGLWFQSNQPMAFAGGFAILGIAVTIGGCFSGELVNRIQRAYQNRTLLSFPYNAAYLAYNHEVLGKSVAGKILDRQNKIEAGRGILAVMSVPFNLDFARNPIFSVNEVSFLNPWSDFPLNTDPEAARQYLLDMGIPYVIFEHQGIGVKTDSDFADYKDSPYWNLREVADRNIRFRNILRYLAENSHLVIANSRVMVFDVSRKTLLPSLIPWAQN